MRLPVGVVALVQVHSGDKDSALMDMMVQLMNRMDKLEENTSKRSESRR